MLNGAYFSCAYAPRTIKFATFIDHSVEKNKSIYSKHRDYKILP